MSLGGGDVKEPNRLSWESYGRRGSTRKPIVVTQIPSPNYHVKRVSDRRTPRESAPNLRKVSDAVVVGRGFLEDRCLRDSAWSGKLGNSSKEKAAVFLDDPTGV